MPDRATHVVLVGHFGKLADRLEDLLRSQDRKVAKIGSEEGPSPAASAVKAVVCFPFGPEIRRAEAAKLESNLARLRELIRGIAEAGGLERIVLRSRGTAYGLSFKNYGLMEEDRVSLLDPGCLERRWLLAEEMVAGLAADYPGVSAVSLRFTNLAHPNEGDPITRMFLGRVAFPAAGCDPRVQFVSLEDAARALALAVDSESTGILNITGQGTVEFRRALRVTSAVRFPIPHTWQRAGRQLLWKTGLSATSSEFVNEIQYNWTLSPDRASRELAFQPSSSSAGALRGMLHESGSRGADRISEATDEFGLDVSYLDAWSLWFRFLCKVYWRVEAEGLENLPRREKALLVSNHRGFMPFDGVVHRSLIAEATGRQVRFLVIPSLFKFPFLSDFLIKQGGVVASQLNAARLFGRDELVGIFPEGINGAFRRYKGAYQLGPFGRDYFAKLAIQFQAPVIPVAVVGHVEIFPILGQIKASALTRWLGWPFIPLTPTFPLLPVPLPTKWHVRYLEPVSVASIRPEEAENRKIVKEFSNHIRQMLQTNIDDILRRRKHIFFGRVFGKAGSAAPVASVPGD